ncbi:MAG: GGDEF domain-containing protein [Lachnospiraceae bacterium]|nr:GGDEF domain-containing protein [Lachnospiraceae bacterium]
MEKKSYSIKSAYLVTFVISILMLFLQLFILSINHQREAKVTTGTYLQQVEVILAKNEHQEDALINSLKDDYISLAKAVSYNLDNNPKAIDDIKELQKICSLMSIDEIHIFDETGKIFASSVESDIGYTFDSGEQIAYFKPMLSDRTLTMFQNITPNTAEGKMMVYAITWNEKQTQMVQIGVESTRLENELKLNELQTTVDTIPLDKYMSIVITDKNTGKIEGSSEREYLGKSLDEISNLNVSSIKDTLFKKNVNLSNTPFPSFCTTKSTDKYYICVFLNYHYFLDRTLQSLIIILVYLVISFFSIIHIIKKLLLSREENIQHMEVFQSMSEIYYSLHMVNLKKNTVKVYSAKDQVRDSYNESSKKAKADEMMISIMYATMSDEYLDRGLEFTDINSLPERMKDKKVISMELLGKNVGWIRMSFITITEEDGYPVKIIVATQIIDEEKKMAESLYEKSHIDELTKCYNRRAYNNDIQLLTDCSENMDYAYVSLDLNGLKTVNDTLGHEAGDELIKGAVDCMNKAFSGHGKVYRVGGDEFAAILSVDGNLMKMLCDDLEKYMKEWEGELVKELSISYGYVLSDEVKGQTMSEIANLADKRMYEAKEKYYKDKGITRRHT